VPFFDPTCRGLFRSQSAPSRRTTIAIVLLALCASPAAAVDRVPRELVGDWCVDQNALAARPTDEPSPKITIYKRVHQCETSEDSLIVSSDRLFIAGEVECKLLQILSITGNGTHRLKFRCHHASRESWIFDAWMSMTAANRLALREETKSEKIPSRTEYDNEKVSLEDCVGRVIEYDANSSAIQTEDVDKGGLDMCFFGDNNSQISKWILKTCPISSWCKVTGHIKKYKDKGGRDIESITQIQRKR
jgi:hypothetical protein